MCACCSPSVPRADRFAPALQHKIHHSLIARPTWPTILMMSLEEMPMHRIIALWPFLARVLMASLFIWDGVLQLRDPAATAKYFASVHIPFPGPAVWISILVHLLGGLALVLGFKTRWAAAVLLLLCLGTAFGVHLTVGDINNMTHFYKNLAMAGGFLYVITYGAGGLSIDEEHR